MSSISKEPVVPVAATPVKFIICESSISKSPTAVVASSPVIGTPIPGAIDPTFVVADWPVGMYANSKLGVPTLDVIS